MDELAFVSCRPAAGQTVGYVREIMMAFITAHTYFNIFEAAMMQKLGVSQIENGHDRLSGNIVT